MVGMERTVSGLILAFVLLQFPVALAQIEADGPAPSTRIIDPADDARQIGPNSDQPDNGEHPQADILEVWIGNETLETVEFGIRLKELQGPGGDPAPLPLGLVDLSVAPGFTIYWSLGLSNFSIQAGGEITNCGGSDYSLRRQYPRGSSTNCGGFEPEVDAEGRSLRFTIPRERLVNETDVPFGPGADITNFYATASVPISPGPAGTTARDRAPDEAFGPLYHSTLAGEEGSGAFTLTALQPVRVSNGESTTLVYPVDIANLEDTPRVVHMTVKNDMPDWQIRVPARLQIAAKETITFPVILSMGFSHDHGGLTTFDVRAQDTTDPTVWAKVRLGVYWLDTPQPAGHHDTLWLHSGGSHGYGFGFGGQCSTMGLWFNPREIEPDGAATEGDAAGCDFTPGDPAALGSYGEGQTFTWMAPLDPPLAIGLDFDLERTGHFTVGVKSKIATTSATLRMQLLYCDTDLEPEPSDPYLIFARCTGKWVLLADASDTRALSANGQADFDLEFTPTAEADFLPFTRESNLMLYVTLQSEQFMTPPGQSNQQIGPLLVVKGSKITLPLIEYHDPIDQAFQNVGALELDARDNFEKPINPGRRSLFTFDLANRGTVPQTVELQIEGHNREWARIVGPTTVELVPGAKSNFTILSEAPVTASVGERAELFIVAQSQTDPNVVAIARLRSTVVDPQSQDVPDEDPAKFERDAEGAPGLGLVAILAVTLVAWSMRRRTH